MCARTFLKFVCGSSTVFSTVLGTVNWWMHGGEFCIGLESLGYHL